MSVTLRPNRYILVCAGCLLLTESLRRDRMTCSGACRVRAHRSGELASLRAYAARRGIENPAAILHAAAVERLRPDLADAILAGTLTLANAQRQTLPAWDELLATLRRAPEAA